MPSYKPSRRTLLSLLSTMSLLACSVAQAQTYPDKPIRMTIPFAAGGGTDVVGRILAQYLRVPLGQNLVVENKAGAGGTVGAQQVVGAAADGYNLLFSSLGPLTITPHLPGMKMGFDPLKDLTPIAMVARQPVLLVVNNKLGIQRFEELLALGKTRDVSYATPGSGTELHLIAEMFRQASNTRLLHVPYRGGGPAITDLVGGNVDMMFVVTSSIMGFVKSGAVKVLGTTDPKRLNALPDVPTMTELGFKEVNGTASWGLLAPRGLPPVILERLYAAMKQVSEDPEFRRRMADAGVEVTLQGPTDFANFLRRENQTWQQVIQKGGIRAD